MSLLNRQMMEWSKWRSQFNALRRLTIQRAVMLLELADRGAYADIQWLYRSIEMTYPTLVALIARRTSAIKALDVNFKTVPKDKLPSGCTEADANKQAAALRNVYEGIDNLRQAIEFLAMAEFRGYSHLEKQYVEPGKDPMSPQTPSQVNHLEVVEQWYWCRFSIIGKWNYNGGARSGVTKGDDIEYANFIIREIDRPINRIALLAFIRWNLSMKDWDAFVEMYGISPATVIGPPNVPPEKQDAYRDAAEEVAAGQSGYLPNGSSIEYPTGVRGMQPFDKHINEQNEQVVLAGTGGLLTMLTEAGSGTLAGTAHRETFEKIADGEARMISEIFQKQFDAPILDELFPNKPHLAYFELAPVNEVDTSLVFDHAVKAAAAGLEVDAAQISEKTGYTLTKAAAAAPGAGSPFGAPKASLGGDLQLSNRKFLERIAKGIDLIVNRKALTPEEEERAMAMYLMEASLGRTQFTAKQWFDFYKDDARLVNRTFFQRVGQALKVIFNSDAGASRAGRGADASAEQTRQQLIKNAIAQLGQARARNYLAVKHRLELIEAMDDPQEQRAAAKKLYDDLPSMFPNGDAKDNAMVKAYRDTITAAVFDGIAEGAAQRRKQ